MAVAEAPARNLVFDATEKRHLAELFAPCFTLVLQLRAASQYGDADVLRRRIKELLDGSEKAALRAGLPAEDVRQARFALVAFIDETILSSDWTEKDWWVARPLQLEYYDRYDAGEVFFDRLDTIRKSGALGAEVLEVYYFCMALGFKGRYQIHDQERLRVLIEETAAQLAATPGMGAGPLAPHGKPRGQLAAEMRSSIPPWIIAACAAAIALLLYVGMSLYMSSAAGRTADAIEERVQGEE